MKKVIYTVLLLAFMVATLLLGNEMAMLPLDHAPSDVYCLAAAIVLCCLGQMISLHQVTSD